MHKEINSLLDDMLVKCEQIEKIFEDAQEKFLYTLEDGRVFISREVELLQSRYRTSLLR